MMEKIMKEDFFFPKPMNGMQNTLYEMVIRYNFKKIEIYAITKNPKINANMAFHLMHN
jgi:hypothetical protein